MNSHQRRKFYRALPPVGTVVRFSRGCNRTFMSATVAGPCGLHHIHLKVGAVSYRPKLSRLKRERG